MEDTQISKTENPVELIGHCYWMIVHLIIHQTPVQTSLEIMQTRKATTIKDSESKFPLSISLKDI